MNPTFASNDPLEDAERGLLQDEFFFLLQPKFALHAIRLAGFEYLMRWHHPARGVLEPASFISMIEDSYLAARFTDLLTRRATRMLARWKAAGYGSLSLAINLSPSELGHADFPARLSALLASLGLEPCRVEIELTDVVPPARLDWLVEAIHATQAIGVRVALDDFGAGFNSLTLLQQLPVDIVKFDRSLIRDVMQNSESMRVVETLVHIAKGHGKHIVMTGIETAEQFEWASTLPEVDGQGFYFGEPLHEAAVETFIADSHARIPS
ncbi:EAL domain-containing protein [Burkholderia lata]|uniref:Diguanylate phosphodiesterase n=1 Tax=Burkholderia lata (strain ATCC 17760 / DSM 23089 / LMG 22485 / NCIMB 9086 / R18194 / 383) TaxID=482957 RepID=A0A6P2H2A1_BURL3|nr:EAL domain-containing protein [Burkholderia lata]VWB10765.1 diguanylate phosphodiesterase [Burkholderia lata]VWB17670.1 diguanylate phosphodiesterase [Burkholderia lata]